MPNNKNSYFELTKKWQRVAALSDAIAMLSWDRQAIMPSGSGSARAQQIAILSVLKHEEITDPLIVELIDKADKAELDDIDLFEVLKNAKKLSIRGKQTKSLISFYNLIKKYHDLTDKLSASEISRSLIEEAGIVKQFKDSTDPFNKERLENINELLLSIDEFCKRNPGSSLKDFLQEVALLTDIDQWNSSKNKRT